MSVSENIYKDTRKRMLETAAKNGITCSNFEITTAVAFTIFQEEGVDICIIGNIRSCFFGINYIRMRNGWFNGCY